MEAIVVSTAGTPEAMAIQDIPTPAPGPAEARVRVRYAGVNFMDVGTRTGLFDLGISPLIPGVEGMGVVEVTGPDVQEFQPGQRVAWYFHPGSYADSVIIPADRLVPVPDNIEDITAAALPMQGLTAHHLATESFPVRDGHVCLVHAASGGVGALLTQIITGRGGRVIARVSSEDKVAHAREAGAEHVLVGADGHFSGEVLALTEGRGVDAVFDAIGAVTYEDSIASLVPHGVLVSFGTASGPVPPIRLESLPRSILITYSTVMDHVPTHEALLRHSADLFGWVASGRLRLQIGKIYPLQNAAQAHRDIESRRTMGKLLLSV